MGTTTSSGSGGATESSDVRGADGQTASPATPNALPLTTVALVAGLTFWWPFYRKFEYSALFSLHAEPAVDMWAPYTPIMLLLFAALLLGAVLHERVERALRGHRLAGCVVSATASLGWLLMYAAPLVGQALPQGQAVVETVGCALSAIGYAALTLCWGASLAGTPARRSAAALSVAIVLSTLTQLTAFLPGNAVMLAVAILSPTLSAVCWFAYGIPAGSKANSEAPTGRTLAAVTAGHAMPLGALGMLGIFLIAGRVGVGLLSYSAESIPGNDRLLTIVFTVILTVCLIAAAARARDWGHLFQLAWSALAVIFMAAMFLLLAGSATLDHIATATLSAVLTCFEMALFVILAMSAYLSGTSGALAFGLASALFRVLPHYMGKTLAPLLMNADAGWAEQVTSFVIPVMLFMLVVATIVFMNARIMGRVRWLEGADAEGAELASGQAGQAGRADRVGQLAEGAADGARPTGGTGDASAAGSGAGERERVDAIASKAGLTPRETDVLLLVSEGRSYQRIADTLNISLGTVQGHVKCIYRKLDVHTKQEIIELVRAR